ncbi:MAG: hypothetical protein JO332_17620 [Planctomycetaceae bacterium]|nr:hypothetical protein [Planctomycetaceae bacterium]
MIQIGVRSLLDALEGAGGKRDLDAGLRRHLSRLQESARSPMPMPGREMPEIVAPEEGPQPLSDLFLALCESVAANYLEQRRPESAPEVVWEAFAARPRLNEYRALRDWSLKAGTWLTWRKKAWDWLAGREGQAVSILLWEGHLEEAWTQARQRGATDEEWLELARRREQDHPEEAFEIYRNRVERLLPRSDPGAYRESVRWLRRLESLQGPLGKAREFAELMEAVRARSRRRPRWVKILDESLGPGAFLDRGPGDEAH